MPPRKSRYFFPVESKTYAPRPWVMTTGWRLYVGRRNCSASSRRMSGLGVWADPCLSLLTGRVRDFSFDDVRIMPPKEPLARQTTVRGGLAFQESARLPHSRMVPPNA